MITGTILALTSGVFLGFFQVMHRKANEEKTDRLFSLIILLTVSLLVIVLFVVFSNGLSHLLHITRSSFIYFSLSGLIHFFLGFHLMGLSQQKIGASRTGVLTGATPVFSAIFGLLIFQEVLLPMVLLGILIVIVGVLFVSGNRTSNETSFHKKDILYGLGTSLCYSISPVLVKYGLISFNFPTIGVGIGMASALLAAIIMYILNSKNRSSKIGTSLPGKILQFEILAGVFIGVATSIRYMALNLSPLAVVTTLTRVNIPVIMLLSPLLLKSRKEKNSPATWTGAGLIILGAVVIGFTR